MAPMMKNTLHIVPPKTATPAEESWSGLYARIRALALGKAAAMAGQDVRDEGEFDRGARALRMLMSAADIARRLKDQDTEEKDRNARHATPAVSDARIRALKTRLEDQIARLEHGEREGQERTAPESGDAS